MISGSKLSTQYGPCGELTIDIPASSGRVGVFGSHPSSVKVDTPHEVGAK